MAHRNQLRIRKGGDFHGKPNIRLVRLQPAPEANSEANSEDEFRGFSAEEIRRSRKRKIVIDNPRKSEISPEILRRSKRPRRVKSDNDYVYLK